MHGPPLVRHEVAALLRRQVDQLEALGAERTYAVAAVAGRHGVEAHRVAWLIGDTTRAEPLCADRAGVEAS